jgi:hypothetical protein
MVHTQLSNSSRVIAEYIVAEVEAKGTISSSSLSKLKHSLYSFYQNYLRIIQASNTKLTVL